ncbi:MAG: tyrosine phenol-lyase, partial [Synergistaceae bacterium]|nr:tyrosine phenol-lyase [Synergistaceae bacterium]
VNRRTYTNSHIEYVAESIVNVYKRRDSIRWGLEMVYEPPVKGLKHFLAHLKPVAL